MDEGGIRGGIVLNEGGQSRARRVCADPPIGYSAIWPGSCRSRPCVNWRRLAMKPAHVGWLLLVVFALLGLRWYLSSSAPVRPRVATSTTYLTAPLAADGLPDYAAHRRGELGAGVTPENNGAIPLLQAFWPMGLAATEQQLLCRELGIPVPIAKGWDSPKEQPQLRSVLEDWLGPDASRTQEDAIDDGIDRLLSQSWSASEVPPAAAWLIDHAAQFALLHDAAARSKFYLPSTTLLAAPHVSWLDIEDVGSKRLRDAALWLAMRANLAIGQGDLQAAWQDCRAIHRLASHVPSIGIVEELVAIAIRRLADDVALQLFAASELSVAIAADMHKFYEQLPRRAAIARALDYGERLTYITSVLAFASLRESSPRNSAAPSLTPLSPERAANVDWSLVLEVGNGWYDRYVDAANVEDWAARTQAFDRLSREM